MNDITRQAIEIIDKVKVRYPGPLRLSYYIDALLKEPGAEPLTAALKNDGDLARLAQRYGELDALAVKHQRHYFLPRTVGIIAAYALAILVAIGVYASGSNNLPLINILQPYLAPTQWALVILMFVCMAAMYSWSGARSTWAVARAQAEDFRASFYARLMSAAWGQGAGGDAAARLMALRLECFRRHLLQEQFEFFEGRIRRHRWLGWAGKGLGWLALLLIAVASVPQMVASLATLVPVDLLPGGVRNFIDRLLADRQLYALAWLGGSSLQLVLARLAFVSPVARHIDAYKVVLAVLGEHSKWLGEAREAAARGDFDKVTWFARCVQDTLAGERHLWDELEVFGRPLFRKPTFRKSQS
jgi:hypothetical protein